MNRFKVLIFGAIGLVAVILLAAASLPIITGGDSNITGWNAALEGGGCTTSSVSTLSGDAAVQTYLNTINTATGKNYRVIRDGITIPEGRASELQEHGLFTLGGESVTGFTATTCGSSAVAAVAHAATSGTPTAGNVGLSAKQDNIIEGNMFAGVFGVLSLLGVFGLILYLSYRFISPSLGSFTGGFKKRGSKRKSRRRPRRRGRR